MKHTILKNLKNEPVLLTNNETEVYNAIKSLLNDGQELIYVNDLEHLVSYNFKILRGVLSSLIKKKLIDVNTSESGLLSWFWD